MDLISADGISLHFNREGGVIDDLAIVSGGRTIQPLHRAPWLESAETLPDSVAPVERRLAGDFFCAPFARSGPGVPIHGWSANGDWEGGEQAVVAGAVVASYRLKQQVSGARLEKTIALRPGEPVVYQTHVFEGGAGRLPVAHHAMVRVPGGARLSFSQKSGGRTMAAPPETDPARGRSILLYPQSFTDLSAVRQQDGALADLGRYPFHWGHEDIVVLSERPGRRVGWSAALAASDGFLFFALKDALMLPQTVLWMSNGGRSYAPWNGRHVAVLGIEEAATDIHLQPGEDRPDGVPTDVELGAGRTVIRYAFGAVVPPQGWSEIADITVSGDTLTLVDRGGGRLMLPFDGGFFAV